MHFTCTYKSGTNFGTGRESANYVATVSTNGDDVSIKFDFRSPPQGKSHPGVTDAKVKSLSLHLSQNEALQLAASIIAQAHHPAIHDSTAKWIPPQFMPVVTKNRWSHGLSVSANYWNNEVEIKNKTKLHIGTIKFKIAYDVYGENYETEEYTTEIRKLVDLPPGATKTIDIVENEIPSRHRRSFNSISTATAIEVTGIVPGDVK